MGSYLSLPSEIIVRLGLSWRTSNIATLGDGSQTLFDLYTGTIIWDGQYRTIDVAKSETEPLLGLSIFRGYRLQVDNVQGGIVKIEAL
jgi:predicted aspartyl protease